MELYLGTWQVAPSDGFWTGQDLSESENVISSAVRLGVRGFDTAQSYGKGQAEQTLSKVLRRFCAGAYGGCVSGDCASVTAFTAGRTLQSFRIDTKIMPSSKAASDVLKVSLNRLSPFSVDCLYLHWPRTGFDNAGYLREMAKLKEAGLVGRIGLCNAPLDMLQGFVRDGLKVDRIQIPVSLLWTRNLDETLAFCREKGIAVVAYSPTGMGLLSGKYRESESLHDARAGLFCFKETCLKPYLELLDLLSFLADKHGVSNTRIALSWVASKMPDIIVIGARSREQLEENLSGCVALSEAELSDLGLAARRLDLASQAVCDNIFSYRW